MAETKTEIDEPELGLPPIEKPKIRPPEPKPEKPDFTQEDPFAGLSKEYFEKEAEAFEPTVEQPEMPSVRIESGIVARKAVGAQDIVPIVKIGTQTVAPQTVFKSPELTTLRMESPKLYSILVKKGYDPYKKAVSAERFVTQQQTKQFKRLNTQLPDEQWMSNSDLRELQIRQPEIYKIAVEQGLIAANEYVERYNQAIQKQQEQVEKELAKGNPELFYIYKTEGTEAYNKAIEKHNKSIRQTQNVLTGNIPKGISKLEVTKLLWRALTPWSEETGQTFPQYMKGYPKRLKQTIITNFSKQISPTQEELKAKYETTEEAPLWAKLLFPNDIVYDKRKGYYYEARRLEAPVLGKGAKAVEQTARKIVKVAVKERVDWSKITKAIERGKVKSAQDAVTWAKITKPIKAAKQRAETVRNVENSIKAANKVRANNLAAARAKQKNIALSIQEQIRESQRIWRKTPSKNVGIAEKAIRQRLAQIKANKSTTKTIIAPTLSKPALTLEQLTDIKQATATQVRTIQKIDALQKQIEQLQTKTSQREKLKDLTEQQEKLLIALQLQLQEELAIQTITATIVANAVAAATQTKTKTQAQEKVKEAIQEQVKAIPESKTKLQVKEQIKNITETTSVTQIKPVKPIKPPIRPIRLPIDPTKPPIEPIDHLKPLKPLKPIKPKIIKLKLPKNDSKKQARKLLRAKAPIAWRQGFVWWIISYPYKSKSDVTVSKTPPANVIRARGIGSAFKTIQALGGDTSLFLKLDMGIQDIVITGKGKKIKIKYKRDIKQKTRGDIALKGVRL